MTQTTYISSYPYRHRRLLAEWLASSKQTPRAVLKRSFPYSRKTTGVQMEFGRMDTLYQRSVLPQKLSNAILQTKVNWMRVKEQRSLTEPRYPVPLGRGDSFFSNSVLAY